MPIDDLNFSFVFKNISVGGGYESDFVKANISGEIQYINLSKNWNVYIRSFSDTWMEIYDSETNEYIRFNWTNSNVYAYIRKFASEDNSRIYIIQPTGSWAIDEKKQADFYWADAISADSFLINVSSISIGQNTTINAVFTTTSNWDGSVFLETTTDERITNVCNSNQIKLMNCTTRGGQGECVCQANFTVFCTVADETTNVTWIAEGCAEGTKEYGNISTLADPNVVENLEKGRLQ